MKKYFANYNQSLALKELGFKESCLMYIDDEEDLIDDDTAEWLGAVKCPLKSQVFEFFRVKSEMHGTVLYYGKNQWSIELLDYKGNQLVQIEDNTFWSREEAESACIDKLIEIVC